MMDIFISVALLVGFFVISNGIEKWIRRVGEKKRVSPERVFYVQKIIQLIAFFAVLLGAGVVFGINYDKFGFIVSSVFAVLGIALFAQWSILSNVTASLIIFFFFPYRVGDKVKIYDDKEILEGKIDEITLFHVLIRREQGDVISYPNSLVFQKAIIIEPKRSRNKDNHDGK